MKVFEYSQYRPFVQARLKQDSTKGSHLRLARYLRVHNSLLTKVFKGEQHFTPDQAFAVTEYFDLNPLERDYFMSLVHLERAGDPRHSAWLSTQLDQIRNEASRAHDPNAANQPLSDRNQFIFHSHWYYSAIRLITAVPEFQDSEAISKRLGLDLALVEGIIDFLVATGLCVRKGHKIQLGIRETHIGLSSPMFDRHLSNWRMKALENLPRSSPEAGEFFFTGPIVVSRKLLKKVRQRFQTVIEEITQERLKGPFEELVCLNIDWFRV